MAASPLEDFLNNKRGGTTFATTAATYHELIFHPGLLLILRPPGSFDLAAGLTVLPQDVHVWAEIDWGTVLV